MHGLRRSLAIALVLSSVSAEAATKLIAVLPLDTQYTDGKMPKSAEAALEDEIRDVTAATLAPEGWEVLSGETLIQQLKDNGIDPTKCGAGECALTTAREFKASKFISGAVHFVDGTFTASVRLIDTKTGTILNAITLRGKTATTLGEEFETRVREFFTKGGMLTGVAAPAPAADAAATPVPDVQSTGPRVHKGSVTAAVGTLIVSAKPLGKVRLDLVDPSGNKLSSGSPYENKQAVPGTWTITATATGYEREQQSSEVPADDMATVRFDLKQFGSLKVTGTPAGASVSVRGPGGFKDDGGLPWEADGLKSGSYKVKVTRAGYEAHDETVEVKPGEAAVVRVALKRVEAQSAVARGGTSGGATFRAANLEWQREPADREMDWPETKRYCPNLSLAGGGWRLPSTDELLSLYRAKRSSAVVARQPGMRSEYWTGDQHVDGTAYLVAFDSGDIYGSPNADVAHNTHYVRCVR